MSPKLCCNKEFDEFEDGNVSLVENKKNAAEESPMFVAHLGNEKGCHYNGLYLFYFLKEVFHRGKDNSKGFIILGVKKRRNGCINVVAENSWNCRGGTMDGWM